MPENVIQILRWMRCCQRLALLALLLTTVKGHATSLAIWTFDNLSSLNSALASSGVIRGLSVSNWTVNSLASLDFAGLSNVPNGVNDGYGFGGNNGNLNINNFKTQTITACVNGY